MIVSGRVSRRFRVSEHHSLVNRMMALVFGTCCIVFFVGAIVVGWQARLYESVGKLMPNWKGGQMSTSDGYRIAFLALSMSFSSFCAAYRSWQGRSLFSRDTKPQPHNGTKHRLR